MHGLLPCPYCGGLELKIFTYDYDPDGPSWRYVHCAGCNGWGPIAAGDVKTIDAWNALSYAKFLSNEHPLQGGVKHIPGPNPHMNYEAWRKAINDSVKSPGILERMLNRWIDHRNRALA